MTLLAIGQDSSADVLDGSSGNRWIVELEVLART